MKFISIIKDNLGKVIPLTLTISMLLLAIIIDDMDYGFYTLLKIIVFATSCYFIYLIADKDNLKYCEILLLFSHWDDIIFGWCFILIALIFNPIIPIRLQQDTWKFMDFVAIMLFILYPIIFLYKNKYSKTKNKY